MFKSVQINVFPPSFPQSTEDSKLHLFPHSSCRGQERLRFAWQLAKGTALTMEAIQKGQNSSRARQALRALILGGGGFDGILSIKASKPWRS